MKTYEEVNGTIIGGEYNRYALFTPRGKQHSTFYEDTIQLAVAKSEQIIAEARKEYPEHIFAFGYDTKWELREY